MRKYIWGIAVIIVAVLAYILIPWIDDKPETKPDIPAAVDGVKAGIEIMKDGTTIVPEAPKAEAKADTKDAPAQ